MKKIADFIKICTILIIIVFIGFSIFSISSSREKLTKVIFPGILGDMILREKKIGIESIAGITNYDNFKGYNDLIGGYRGRYNATNITMVIFVAEMKDNQSVNKSVNEMIERLQLDNSSVIKLKYPKNPQIFVIQKNYNDSYHFIFSRENDIFWIGFNNYNQTYQVNMLYEIYNKVLKDVEY